MRRLSIASVVSGAGLIAFAAMLSLAGTASADDAAKTKPATTTTTATAAAPTAQPQMTMKEAKQRLGIVVFPAKGQTPAQQDSAEYVCLLWGADQAEQKAAAENKAKLDAVKKGMTVCLESKGYTVK